jgi:hypothetical protein
MSPIDDAEVKRSLEISERRLADARQRRQEQRKRLLLTVVVCAILAPLGIAAGLASQKAPEAPLLVLTWPKPRISQTVASGQRVVFRRGQPFDLTVTDAQKWRVEWHSPESESHGPAFPWQPADSNSELRVLCHPIPEGWTRFFSWLWPSRELTLTAIAPQKTGNYTRLLNSGDRGAWLNPHIYTKGSVEWDERALQLLLTALPKVPQSQLNNSLADSRKSPTSALWQVVSDFEGNSQKPATDDATYAVLYAPDLENLMPRIARGMLKEAPSVSLKFVVRLDRTPQQGVIRLAFDGKEERRAWIRRKGESSGGPLIGWETENPKTLPGLPPSLPR